MLKQNLILLLLGSTLIFSQDIDWINKTITVTGSAYGKNKLMAKRGAKTDARRNMLEAIKDIRVDSKTIVRDLEVEQDIVITESGGYIKQAWFDNKSTQYEKEGEKFVCTILLTMPLLGDYSKLVLPKSKPANKSIPQQTKSYTGLVIDLRGNKVVPSMAPRIVTKYGGVLYDMSSISRKYATEMGVVGYIKQVENPSSVDRVGDNPLVLKANGISGDVPTDAVVDGDGADMISSLSEKIFDECKVAFLID